MTDNGLMSEFRKLQSETTGIRSLFAEKSSLDLGSLTGNKLAKEIHDFCEKTIELQDKFNKKMLEGQTVIQDALEETTKEILKELRAMRSDLELLKQEVKGKTTVESEIVENEGSIDLDTENPLAKTTEKEFVLRHVFENVSQLDLNEEQFSMELEHFGCKWQLFFWVDDEHKLLYLYVRGSLGTIQKTIEVKLEGTIISMRTGQSIRKELTESFTSCADRGWADFAKWEDIEKDYISDDKLIIEVRVKITKIKGVYKNNLMKFDESMQACSDIVLKVEDRMFYVYKLMHLATQSSYFNSLKSNLETSNISEVIIPDINPDDFHMFLEVLYGEHIDESTVEICLLLAERFDAQTTTRRCEEFLLNISEKDMKTKWRLAVEFKLEELKNSCLSGIKTAADIRELLTGDIRDLDPSLMADLLEKSLSFK